MTPSVNWTLFGSVFQEGVPDEKALSEVQPQDCPIFKGMEMKQMKQLDVKHDLVGGLELLFSHILGEVYHQPAIIHSDKELPRSPT